MTTDVRDSRFRSRPARDPSEVPGVDLLQAVTEARQQRSNAEQSFRAALVRAKEAHSWAEVARAAGVSKSGARWLVRSAQTLEEEK